MKRKNNSIFPAKNLHLNFLVSVLWAVFLAVINWLLLILLNKASEFLARLVPTNEEWTLVVMVIPITVFGIYTSLLLSNYNQNKNLIIWGKTYGAIKDQRYSEDSFPKSFRISTGIMTASFVIYFIKLDYSMLIGSALILSVDLFVLIFLEIYEGTKSQIDLYEGQFSRQLKAVKDIFLTDSELSEIEENLSNGAFETAEKIFLSRCDFFDISLAQLEYELNDIPDPMKKEIWIRFINFFSLELKRIENAIFYKRLAIEIQRICNAESEKGNVLCANEMIFHFAKTWVQKVNNYFCIMTKRIQKRAPRAKRTQSGLLDFLEESLRHKITFNAFFIVQESILKMLKDVDSNPSNDLRKQYIEKNIEKLKKDMKGFNECVEEMLSSIKQRFEEIERQSTDSAKKGA